MQHSIRTVAILGALLCGLPHAIAQSQEQLELASQLVDTMHVSDQFAEKIKALTLGILAGDPKLATQKDLMRDVLDHFVTWEAAKPFLIEVWAQSYSAQELRTLVEFCRSPLGQRFLAAQVELGAQAGRRLIASKKDDIVRFIQERQQQQTPVMSVPKKHLGGG